MDDKQRAMEWAGYMSPCCGKYNFTKAAIAKWKRADREAYLQKHARQELSDKGMLPNSCVVSWTNCGKYKQAMDTQCRTEKESNLIETQQYVAAGRKRPEPAPTPSKTGWVYPASWNSLIAAPGTVDRPDVGGGDEPRIDQDIATVPETSTGTVAAGIGVGVVLLIAGIWLFSSKSKS